MAFNKSVTLTASVLIVLSTGLTYLFGLWAGQLKEVYGLNQEQVEAIGSAGNLGGCGGIVSGLFYDGLQRWPRAGPRLTILIGLAVHGTGYSLLWAAVSRRIAASYWQLLAFAALACNGGTWLDTAALATNVRNYPSHRGSVVGTLKSGVGLSASLYATAYGAAFQGQPAAFLLFLALCPVAVGLAAVPFINCVPQRGRPTVVAQRRDEARFAWAMASVGALAAYLAATSVLGSLWPLSPRLRMAVAAGAAALLLPLALIPVKRVFTPPAKGGAAGHGAAGSPAADSDRAGAAAGGPEGGDDGLTAPLLPPGSAAAEPPAACDLADLSLGQLVRGSPDFWLLFGGAAVGTGAALTFLNNLGQMVLALGGPPGGQAVFLSLFSVASAAGRLVWGYLPEKRFHQDGTPRPLFLVGVSSLMALVCLGAAAGRLGGLYALSVLAGMAFGAHWVLMASIVSEIGGLRCFASNYTGLQLAPALGSYALSSKLAGWLYDREARRQGSETSCAGPQCYRLTFLLLAGLGLAATACSYALYRRTRGLYRRLHASQRAVPGGEEEEAGAGGQHSPA